MNAQRLKKYCVFKGQEWIDVIRIHALPAGGYIVHHTEEEDLHLFDSIQEALEFIATEYIASKPSQLRIGECP